jgi:hypothetical protein
VVVKKGEKLGQEKTQKKALINIKNTRKAKPEDGFVDKGIKTLGYQ